MASRFIPFRFLASLAVTLPFVVGSFAAGPFAAGCGGSNNNRESSTQDASPDGVAKLTPVVDLRVDNNRNGIVELDDPSEDLDEDLWDQTHGAVFLANIDDDTLRCPKTGSDVDLASCNDAQDDIVNGKDDLLDMARLKTVPWIDAPEGANGRLILSEPGSEKVRLFLKGADGEFAMFDPASDEIAVKDLREGAEFAIEGKDIVRDASEWDGFINITLRVTVEATSEHEAVDETDTVRMRISPVMTFHHLLPVETSYVVKPGFWADLTEFVDDFREAVNNAGVPGGLTELSTVDQWTQDFFETGYMSMPAPGEEQHVIRVVYRSANVDTPWSNVSPLRPSGRLVFTAMRGKDVAGVQHYDRSHSLDMGSLDSMGNTETIPPYELDGVSYPLGRLFRGSVASFYPDRLFSTMLESQGQQPPVYVDTSWLFVGHVDETISFIKANSPRGWVVLANDARLAKKMLEDAAANGHGSVTMFTGKKWVDDNDKEYPAEATIDEVLANTQIMSESAKAAVEVDAQLDILRSVTGITDAEIIPVPFLHWPAYGYSLAYQPGTVNGTYLSDLHFAAPNPHGPIIDGKDIFKVQLEETLQPFGITVDWIENWDGFHRLDGEVHCGSNSDRRIPNIKWWETGR